MYGHLHTLRRIQSEDVRVYWDEKQKDGTLLSDVVYKGQYNVDSFSINKDVAIAAINLDLSLSYNLSTLRFGNVNIFKNLGL